MPTAKSNNASAISNMMRNIGGSFGISAVTALIARREQYHQNMLVEHATPLSSPYAAAIGTLQQAYLSYTPVRPMRCGQAEAQVYATVQQQAALLSFNDCFWAMAVVLAAIVPLVLLMRKPSPGAAPPHGH
jgi:MFS transporter, DHA2 family, multidrug resistance protein